MVPDDLDSMDEGSDDLPDPGIDPIADRSEARRLYRGAVTLHRNGDLGEALWGYGQAIQRDPSFAAAYSQLGAIRITRGQFRAAEAALRRAIALDPGNALAHTRLGEALRRQSRTRDAAISQVRALQIAPDDPHGHLNLGRALRDMGLAGEAITSFNRALDRGDNWTGRDQSEARWERAQTVLMTGDLAGGFGQMDGHWEMQDVGQRGFDAPVWDGSDLTGKSLLVQVGVRMGDVIQFARFLPILARRGTTVMVECHAPLLELMATIDGVAAVIPRGDVIPRTDYRASVMSLPHLMGVDFTRLGDLVPYVDPERRPHRELPKLSGVHLRVGITWGGRDLHCSDSDRLSMLERFLTLLRVPGVALYSFQRREHSGDLEAVGATELVQDVGPMINSMVDSAALLRDIDLLISVDTAVAHLAGAMGRPVWLMVPHAPEWRWQMQREDSPWYPTFKLFRQKAPGEWDELLDRIGEALRPMVPAGAAGRLAAAVTTLGRQRPPVDETLRRHPVEPPAPVGFAELEREARQLDTDGPAPDPAAPAHPIAAGPPGSALASAGDLADAAAAFKTDVAETDAATEFADLTLPEDEAPEPGEPEPDEPLDLVAMEDWSGAGQIDAGQIEKRSADAAGDGDGAPPHDAGQIADAEPEFAEDLALSLDSDQIAAAEDSFGNAGMAVASADDDTAGFDGLATGGDTDFATFDTGGDTAAAGKLDPEQLAAGQDTFGDPAVAPPPAPADPGSAMAVDPDQMAAAEEMFGADASITDAAPSGSRTLTAAGDTPANLSLDDDQLAAAGDMFDGPAEFAELDLPDEDDAGSDALVEEEPVLDLPATITATPGGDAAIIDAEPVLSLNDDQLAAAAASFEQDDGPAGPDFAVLDLPEEEDIDDSGAVADEEPALDLGTLSPDMAPPDITVSPEPDSGTPGPGIDFAELDLPEDDADGTGAANPVGDAPVDDDALDLDLGDAPIHTRDTPPTVADRRIGTATFGDEGAPGVDIGCDDDDAGGADARSADDTGALDGDGMAEADDAIALVKQPDLESQIPDGGDLAADAVPDEDPVPGPVPHPPPLAGPAPRDDPDNPEAMLPSALVDNQRKPRFHMSIRANDLTDPDIKELCRQEAEFGGFAYAARRFLDDHVMPGDLFIDYGAHWGTFTLTVATRWPGDTAVLAIEPSPDNFERLGEWLRDNHYDSVVDTVQALLGYTDGDALIDRGDGSMRRVCLGPAGADDGSAPAADFTVPITRLDALLADRPALQGRRTFLRLNANGHEQAVLAGARDLLGSGNVAAILIYRGRVHDAEPVRSGLLHVLDSLSQAGFHHYRVPHELQGGVLIPYVYNHEFCTIFSLATDFQRWQSYDRPMGPYLPAPRPSSVTLPLAARAQWAELLMQHYGTDGGRWAHPDNLEPGAEDRATLIARHLPPESRVLDVGAGVMALRLKLSGGHYQPVDLMARRSDVVETMVLDLNQEQYPEGDYDVVVLSRVLELIHDPSGLLSHLATLAPLMILVYRVYDGSSSIEERRAAGWFNDFTDAQLKRILKRCGWVVEAEDTDGKYRLFACARDRLY